ncbi:MAG: glycosyl hydrolase [Bacteroidota bacterium]
MRKLTFALMFFLTFNSNAQVKPTSAADRLKTSDQKKALLKNSLVNQIPFRNIGPSVMSGRVVDIDANPTDPTEFYVAYASGGVWYTNNNGQSFTSIFDSESTLTIGDIAVNWPAKIIWVGTGEVNSSRSSYAGNGMYKSTDNGKHWDYLGLPESQHIGKIQLHPTDPNTIWVAALGHLFSFNKERGVYKTTDGGKSWQQTLAIDDKTGAVDIEINPKNPDELYAAMWYRTRTAWNFEESGKTSGIYKSLDGGNNWTLISTEGSGFPTGEAVGRIGLAISPKNPNVVYAVLDNQIHLPDTAKKNTDTSKYTIQDFKNLNKEQFLALDDRKLGAFTSSRRSGIPAKYTASVLKDFVKTDKLKPSCIWDYLFDANTAMTETPITGCEVYRSENNGQSWKKVSDNSIPGFFYSTYGYYFGKIFVSPTNENKVFITGLNVMMSVDGGKSFQNISKEHVHSDHHSIWIDPAKDSHIINGNDGGCNISYDDGAHWFKANTPAVGQFYNIAVDNAKPYNVYGGLQDNGTWYGSSTTKENYSWYESGNNPFQSINGGDGMQVQVDLRDNKTIYSGSQYGSYSRQSLGSKENKYIKPSNDLGEPQFRFNWQSPILLSKHNQDILYYGSNKFHRSFNKGDSLPAISEDLTTNPVQGDVPFGTLSTISESPLKFGLIYVGTDDGNVQISKDGGYSWTLISKKLPKGLYVSRVIASAYQESRVYVSLNGYRNDNFLPYLYVSEDYGNTWKQIGKTLPNEPINVIKEDHLVDGLLYVGTDGGVYVSIDAGDSFMSWNKGLPYAVPVHDIVTQARENEIIIGTHGRSIYIGKLDEVQKLIKDPEFKNKKLAEIEKIEK